MDSKQLSYFCAVVRERSFTRAAAACHVSQSALSQQVKGLESALGVNLLERQGRSLVPTAAGELLASKGRDLLAQLSELEAETIDVGSGRPRRLMIGYLNRYEGWEVAGAVAAFARRHPGCEVVAESGTHDQLYRAMADCRIDVSFSDRRRALSEEWENRHLADCFRYAEVSEASSVAWRESVSCPQLSQLPCILVCPPEQRGIEEGWWRDIMGFSGGCLYAKSTDEGRMMVAGNRGWMPLEAREKVGRTGTVIRRIPLHDGSGHSKSEYYAFWPKSRTNPLIEEFARMLEDLFGAL